MSEDTKQHRIAIDVGGTFTDIVSLNTESGQLRFDKVPTTPKDPQQGVLNGMDASQVSREDISFFIHGTTLGLNALLTRRGARMGIVTTKGFRDVYLLGRTDRIPMYDFKFRKPQTLVTRDHIFEVTERLNFEGNVLTEFDEISARAAAESIKEQGLEAVAVCFLHSYVNPAHEEKMAAILKEIVPNIEITLSSRLSREIREYERTSTAVLDAYIKPIVRNYINKLQNSLKSQKFIGQFLMTRSGGGAMTAESAKEAPVNLILSGPAGGVLGAAWFAKATEYKNLITIDMGGTSLDASLVVDTQPLTYYEASFEGLPINLASLYIHTIGAGGGSLVWIDEGSHLQVGPMSAGADPGPAAYGQGGTEATFTDAALQVGYLGGSAALAGTLTLDEDLAKAALQKSAEALKMNVDEVALGVIRISVTKIVGAVRAITVELGHTPSDFALLSFGGGGGLVAVDVARELNIPTVIIPPGPGAFCAFGMLMASVQHDFARTKISMFSDSIPSEIEKDFAEMQSAGSKKLEAEGFTSSHQTFQRFIDLRYVGQEHTVTMRVNSAMTENSVLEIERAFAAAHEKAYGHAMPDPVEMVALRLSAYGSVDQPTLPEVQKRSSGALEPISRREVYQSSGKRENYKIYHRDSFHFGDSFEGPAIINEHTGTTVLHAGDSARVGAYGEIVISLGKGSEK